MILLIVLCFLFAITLSINNKWYSPGSMFCFLWGIILLLYKINLFNYNEISEKALVIYYTQMICFFLGSIIESNTRLNFKRRNFYRIGRLSVENDLYPKVFTVLTIVTVFFLLYLSVDVIRLVYKGNSFWQAQLQGAVIENSLTGLMLAIKFYLVSPFCIAVSPICASKIFISNTLDRKSKTLLFISNVLIVFFYTMQHGARNMILIFIISYCFSIAISKRKIKISAKTKRYIIIIGAIVIAFSVFISSLRGINVLWESLYFYFVGTVPHFNGTLEEIERNGYMYGTVSLYGFIHVITFFLSGFGLVNHMPAFINNAEKIIAYTETPIYISAVKTMVAHVGISYAFYADGGIVFVAIGNLLYSFFSNRIFRKAKNETNEYYIAVYLLIMCTVLMSFIRYFFWNSSYIIGMLFIYMFTKNSLKDSELNQSN